VTTSTKAISQEETESILLRMTTTEGVISRDELIQVYDFVSRQKWVRNGLARRYRFYRFTTGIFVAVALVLSLAKVLG